MHNNTNLDSFFKPKSIALIGAAHTEEKLGGVILKNLLKFKGRVYPVNPRYNEMMGLKAYPSAIEIPEQIDLVLIIRPAKEVSGILKELKGKTNHAVVLSSGFAEIGEAALQEELKRTATEAEIRILGPNCMGIYNPYENLDTFFLPYERLKRPGRGNVSVVSQSGAILSCIITSIKKSNAGISKAIGYGNAIDINESEIYEYLSKDPKTDVIVSYIESVCDGRKFVEKAKLLSEKKSLIVLKAGKGESGQAAAFSHTGRLAGRYEVFHSILRQFGIKEVKDFDELMDATKALSYQSVKCRTTDSRCKHVLIITNGGGSGVLAADECMRQGIDVPQMTDIHREKLKKIFPNFYGINNPLDVTAQVKDEDYTLALNELKDDYDGFLFIALPNVYGITEKLGKLTKESVKDIKKPVVFYIAEGGISKKLTAILEKAKIPVYPSPERATRGLKTLLD
jgi:acyl-CoA synthetase (NDP forming)